MPRDTLHDLILVRIKHTKNKSLNIALYIYTYVYIYIYIYINDQNVKFLQIWLTGVNGNMLEYLNLGMNGLIFSLTCSLLKQYTLLLLIPGLYAAAVVDIYLELHLWIERFIQKASDSTWVSTNVTLLQAASNSFRLQNTYISYLCKFSLLHGIAVWSAIWNRAFQSGPVSRSFLVSILVNHRVRWESKYCTLIYCFIV